MLSPQLGFTPWSVIDGFSITPLWLGLRLCSFNISPYKVFKSIKPPLFFFLYFYLFPLPFYLILLPFTFYLFTCPQSPSIPEHATLFRRTNALPLPCCRSTHLHAPCFQRRASA